MFKRLKRLKIAVFSTHNKTGISFGKLVLLSYYVASAVRKHSDDEDKGGGDLPPPGGKQKIIVINEFGLHSLVLSSKLPIVYQNELIMQDG